MVILFSSALEVFGAANHSLRVATFDIDATPPLGYMMAYDPVVRVDAMTLRCRGIVLLGQAQPIVLCAVDWLGIANEAQDEFRKHLAKAAGTTPKRVAVHTLHQHDAPTCDFSAERLLKEAKAKHLGRLDGDFCRQTMAKAAAAVRTSMASAKPVTHCGWGVSEVKQVASNRRIFGPDGKVRAVRYTSCTNPELRAEPEGVIDPELSMLSFWNGDTPLVVMTYYACHPQSYYRVGIPSPDFPGIARFMRQQSVPEALHVHFNGAGGNIGAGKYNDGSRKNRMELALRLRDGMKRAFDSSSKFAVQSSDLRWSVVPVALPLAKHLDEAKLVADVAKGSVPPVAVPAAERLAYVQRSKLGHKIDLTQLAIGDVRVLHMPGELFVEYQLAAKQMRPELNVAMAAYGEYGTFYIGTKRAYSEGGYETEPRSSNVAPEVESLLMHGIGKLLSGN
ncbi:MAG: hypothetical protein QF721_07220 [Verrucomicrobiota bacterium]|nr:hypothetical protein [Verrucomicrobiota bacterium]